jgi:DNA (cytosine-5)-methyltransferase 1
MPAITTAAVRRPRLLDLFCCQGGAAKGYHDAGFDVTGVDLAPQPRYPYTFVQADALEYLAAHWREFDVVHASPPCHDHSALANLVGVNDTGRLLAETRAALRALPLPWVIENVPGASMRVDLMLCGGMFALRTYRHRWFEFADPMFPPQLPHPRHRVLTDSRKRRAGWDAGMHTSVTGNVTLSVASAALDIDWMDVDGLPQAIPPAYTRVVGAHLLDQLTATAGAVA